jgi:hydrogenase maturation protein HypF
MSALPGELAPSVTRGLDTLGIMLPYTPLHYLLFEHLQTDAIVLTSGNLSDEPIVISNEEAQQRLGSVADALLVYNRDIHNRSDDSVAFVANNTPRLLRRSRGWAPEPILLPFDVEGIVATGAELKTCFCVGKGRQAILSQHIGDLKNFETYTFYQEVFERFQRLFRVEPTCIACDMHPDYLSSRFAQETGLPLIQVQHHHAHITACMAEFGLTESVIGVSFDGTGLGDDGAIWGGEFLICDLTGYRRFSHFDYVPLPGGDKAAEQPWRMGLAYLYTTFGRAFWDLDLPLIHALEPEKAELLLKTIDKQIQCPPTSSIGRLFDAVAAITGLVSNSTFEAEAPIRLEAAIDEAAYRTETCYPYRIDSTINVTPLIEALVTDISNSMAVGEIAAKFHQTLVAIILDMAERMRQEHDIHTVVLSGGVFQNRHLLEKAEVTLQTNGFAVYSPLQVPANDGGLCLGQLAVAAMKESRH